MANTTNTEGTLNLDKNVTITSIAGWTTTFQRLTSTGDVVIPPYGSTRLTTNEIIAQVQNNRVLFTGIDGVGSHATLYIEDPNLRQYLGFDSEDGKATQAFLTEDAIKKVFELKTQKSFENRFTELVRTRAEKRYVMNCIGKLKINDFSKIRFAEKHTGVNVELA